MAYKLNYERAAAILVDAAYLGDEAAAKKWKITVRTIYNYRERLKTDIKLSELFTKKRTAAEGDWASSLRRTLGQVLDKAGQIASSIEPVVIREDPETGFQEEVVNEAALLLLVKAGKDLGEIALAMEVLNAGDAETNAAHRPGGQEVDDGPALYH
ncbi:hypothetical protein ACFP81_10575 [Deinococcus lacus]|uniref:Uncharacterized protein n=1 Tax=Deinococcus lacus TaxID=392561 RepID=A0ABW1YFT8_9DEIO